MCRHFACALSFMVLACGTNRPVVSESPVFASPMEPTPAAAEPEPVVEAAVDEEFIVETVENPDRTMTFDFQQSPELGDGTHMMLVVSNPFDRHIRYRLGMMTPNSEKIYATSNCPVGPKIKVIEHWPHPIFQLVFTDMKLVDKETDDLSCRQ